MFALFRNTSKPSKSLRALAAELGAKVYQGKPHCLLYGDKVNKLTQYEWFKSEGLPALSFTTEADKAKEWLSKNKTVFGRKLLNGSEGKGIVVMDTPFDFVECPVYTLYRPKKKEFRVHILKDKVVCVLEKRKKKGESEVDTKVRNTANGYVFCRQNVVEPEGIRELALSARKVTKSDFAGVDIGYDVKNNKLFIIEVNSAPGFEGTTVKDYAAVIKGI